MSEAVLYFNINPEGFQQPAHDGRSRRVDALLVVTAIYRARASMNPGMAAAKFFSRLSESKKAELIAIDGEEDTTETGRRRFWLGNRGVARLATFLPGPEFNAEFRQKLIDYFARLLEGDASVGPEVRGRVEQSRFVFGMVQYTFSGSGSRSGNHSVPNQNGITLWYPAVLMTVFKQCNACAAPTVAGYTIVRYVPCQHSAALVTELCDNAARYR